MHHLRPYLQRRVDIYRFPSQPLVLILNGFLCHWNEPRTNQAYNHDRRRAINIKAGGTRGFRSGKRDCNGHISSGARFCPSTVWTKLTYIFLGVDLNACTFLTKAEGLLAQYTRPSKRLKENPRIYGVHVLAGVGQGKVLLWEYIDGRRWSGAVAAETYKGPVKQCLERAYPDLSKRQFLPTAIQQAFVQKRV